jgi:uncharacterized protein YbjT (DUF2867 family)
MKIAVLGATGRTGSEFVKQALTAGHDVVAYVRRPEAITPTAHLTAAGGQLDDIGTLSGALNGCDAVVVALGPKISDSHAPIMQTAIPSVIAAARQVGLCRVVVLSALGVGNTFENTRFPYRFGCRTFLAGNFRDHKAGEDQLIDSGLDWTTVHPGPLSDAARTPHPLIADAAHAPTWPRAPRTTRADVAALMLSAINDPATYGKQMLVTSAKQTA